MTICSIVTFFGGGGIGGCGGRVVGDAGWLCEEAYKGWILRFVINISSFKKSWYLVYTKKLYVFFL